MRDPVVRLGVVLVAAVVVGCGVTLPRVEPFPAEVRPVTQDFETRDLATIPELLTARSGHWAVADSPEAASGQQVLVQRSDEMARLGLAANFGENVRGEVSLRVVLGEAGAGIGCIAPSGEGVVFKAEPGRSRVGLYQVDTSSSRPLVTEDVKSLGKGSWVRLAILCRPGNVVAFLDDAPILEGDVSVDSPELTLYADAGMTVQFDDLRYVAASD